MASSSVSWDETSIKRIDRVPFADEVRRLSKISPLRWLFAVGFQWMVIMGAATVVIKFDQWYLYPLSVVVIASRQHALGVCLHEGAHYLAFSNRLLNDVVPD